MSEKDEKLNKGSFLYINDEEKAEWGQPEGYPYKEQKLATEFLPETKLTFYTPEGAPEGINQCDGFEVSDFGLKMSTAYVLRIMWDGVAYDREVTIARPYHYTVGNEALFNIVTGETKPDTGEPFHILIVGMTEKRVGFRIVADSIGEHTVNISELSEVIHPMAPEFLPQATQTTYGAIKKAAHVPHVTEAPTSNDFNKLLSALREAGIMSQSE